MSEEKGLFPPFSGFPNVFGPSGREKRPKRGEKGRLRRFPGRADRHPLSPICYTPICGSPTQTFWETSPKTPKPQKVSRKSAERSLGRSNPGHPKSQENAQKVKKTVDSQTFGWTFSGCGVGGSKTPHGRLSGDFLRFLVSVGLCRWQKRT